MIFFEKGFIDAYCWMYGSTKKQAKEELDLLSERGEHEYINSIILCYKSHIKQIFYND